MQDGSPHRAAAWSLVAAEEAQAADFGEKPSFPMANLHGDSPVLGPETAMLTLSSGCTVVLLGCKSFISGLGHPQEGCNLPVRVFLYVCVLVILLVVFCISGGSVCRRDTCCLCQS